MLRRTNRNSLPLPWTIIVSLQLENVRLQIEKIINDLEYYKHENRQLIEKEQFYKEEIIELKRNVMLNLIRGQQMSDIIAELYDMIEIKNLRIKQCLDTLNLNLHRKAKFTCECCCSQKEDHEIVECSNGHVVCKTCINSQCLNLNNSLNHVPDNKIQCCSMHECDGYYHAFEIGQTVEGQKMLNEYYVTKFKTILYDYFTKFTLHEIEKNLHFLNSSGSFKALQCPVCKYGPILHANCDDLLSHHNQHLHSDVYVNNKCPNCGHLSVNVSQMDRWNGFSLKKR